MSSFLVLIRTPDSTLYRDHLIPRVICLLLQMLLLIGNQFDADLAGHINGAVVSLRVKGDRLALWLKRIDDRHLIRTIGRQLKELLCLPDSLPLVYEVSANGVHACRDELTVVLLPSVSRANTG